MSIISDHMRLPQGATAPSSIERLSSGTSVDSSTVRTMPVPPQVGQAPALLKARSSAPGAKKLVPHSGQTSGLPAATSSEGGA